MNTRSLPTTPALGVLATLPTLHAQRRRALLRTLAVLGGGMTLGTTGLTSTVAAPTRAPAAPATAFRVVASFSILADMVRAIAGPLAEVSALVGADGNPHVYEPSPADIRNMRDADLVVVNGLHFETWMNRLIQVSGYHGTVVVASAGVRPLIRRGGPDPHAWQSPLHGLRYAINIAAALSAALPGERPAIAARLHAYHAHLNQLDRQIRAQLAAIPAAHRRVVTAHDAFAYFGEEYGVEFIPAQGWSGSQNVSAASLRRLVDLVRVRGASAVFVEHLADPRVSEMLAREASAVMGGTLYSDALSRPGGIADSYLKLVASNATTIVNALQAASRAPLHAVRPPAQSNP